MHVCGRNQMKHKPNVLHTKHRGRNAEGQCGVESYSPLVTRPTSLQSLHGEDVTQLAAGKLVSAAVLGTGDVLTFGCGKSGKGGHGNAQQLNAPARVSAKLQPNNTTNMDSGLLHVCTCCLALCKL